MVDFSYILTGELMTTRLSKLTDLNTKMSEFTVHKFLKQILKKKKKKAPGQKPGWDWCIGKAN